MTTFFVQKKIHVKLYKIFILISQDKNQSGITEEYKGGSIFGDARSFDIFFFIVLPASLLILFICVILIYHFSENIYNLLEKMQRKRSIN